MSTRSTALGEEVTVDVGATGPYGALLSAGPNGNTAVLVAWERLPNGKFGPIQKDGGVRLGDIMIRLNQVDLHNRRFNDVMTMLRNPGILRKRITFVSKDKYAKVAAQANAAATSRSAHSTPANPSSSASSASSSSAPSFLSVVRSARVNSSVSPPFAEYEVSCSLRLSSRKVDSERIHRWTEWKRYSEFESLDKAIRADFGWQLEAKAKFFPSKNSFSWGKLSVDFVEKRRFELDDYWQAMLTVDRISDFARPHHCSTDLKAFLEVDKNIASKNDDESSSIGGKQPRRKQSVRASSMRVRGNMKSDVRSRSATSTKSKSPTRGSSRSVEGKDEGRDEGRDEGGETGRPPPPPAPNATGAPAPAAPRAAPSAPAAPPPAPEAPSEVVPFLKMLKMGIPRVAVEQKMAAQGVDSSLLDQYADGGGGGGGGAPSAKPRPAPSAAAPAMNRRASNPMAGGLLADLAKNRID